MSGDFEFEFPLAPPPAPPDPTPVDPPAPPPPPGPDLPVPVYPPVRRITAEAKQTAPAHRRCTCGQRVFYSDAEVEVEPTDIWVELSTSGQDLLGGVGSSPVGVALGGDDPLTTQGTTWGNFLAKAVAFYTVVKCRSCQRPRSRTRTASVAIGGFYFDNASGVLSVGAYQLASDYSLEYRIDGNGQRVTGYLRYAQAALPVGGEDWEPPTQTSPTEPTSGKVALGQLNNQLSPFPSFGPGLYTVRLVDPVTTRSVLVRSVEVP